MALLLRFWIRLYSTISLCLRLSLPSVVCICSSIFWAFEWRRPKKKNIQSIIINSLSVWRMVNGEQRNFFYTVCLPFSMLLSPIILLFVALFFFLLKSLRSVTIFNILCIAIFRVLLQMMHHTKINAKSEQEKLSKWIKSYFVTVFSFQHYNAQFTLYQMQSQSYRFAMLATSVLPIHYLLSFYSVVFMVAVTVLYFSFGKIVFISFVCLFYFVLCVFISKFPLLRNESI